MLQKGFHFTPDIGAIPIRPIQKRGSRVRRQFRGLVVSFFNVNPEVFIHV
jgi:hypothetical protein